jgi:hypothetical protein
VANRTLQSSLCPRILRTDSNARKGVALSVVLLSWLATLATLLISIASFVTPLGLEGEINHGNAVPAEFIYAPDTSAFGLGTPLRTNSSFTRSCITVACLGSTITNGTRYLGNESAFNPEIPANIIEAFSSLTGDHGSTLSSPWDIQYRQFSTETDYGVTYSTGTFRALDILMLHKKIEPVEGFIVNSVNGGIGLRNHTVPVGLNEGGLWKEDITWISPSTECVDTNLILHYTLNFASLPSNMYLPDNGGFINLARAYPPYAFDDAQANPDLLGRAYTGALLTNAYLMLSMNTTTLETATNGSDPDSIQLSAFTDSYLGKQFDLSNYSLPSTPDAGAINLGDLAGLFVDNEKQNQTLYSDYLNVGDYLPVDPGKFHERLFQKAAAVKEVTFSLNGTSNLDNLEITVADKPYPDEPSKPLWAVENPGLELAYINTLWGLVSGEYENNTSLFTRRAESLRLPATVRDLGNLSSPSDTTAAANVFSAALNALTSLSITTGAPDYTGKSNFALFHLWQDLSSNSSASSQIIDLIVTDLLASAILGTKTSISSTETQAISGRGTPTALVSPLTNKITYKLLYGIPEFSALLLWMLVILPAFLLWLVRTVNLERLRNTLNDTAAGRVVTSFVCPELCDPAASKYEWIKRAGRVRLVAPSARSGTKALGEDARPVKTREQYASIPNSRLLS